MNKYKYSDFLQKLNELNKPNEPNDHDIAASAYNIFLALGIETKEVLTCRFIGSLLDPNGDHGLGFKPLELFLKNVLGVSDAVDSNANVTLEDVISNNRRVDIVIRNGEHIYPIEVKIWAGDQDTQIGDYYNYYFRKKYKDNKIYYLTPTGWSPSKKSIGNTLNKENVVCLSFNEDISKWSQTLIDSEAVCFELKSIIEQFIEVISIMCKTASEEKSIIGAIGLNEGFVITENLKSLISILKTNGDTNGRLQKTIQKSYLAKHLLFDSKKYILVSDPDKSEIKDADSHAIMFIGTNETHPKIIAWICVATNLYIGCKKLKSSHGSDWKDECWAYIKPDDYKKQMFQLNDCENVLEYSGGINIDRFLNDIYVE